MAGIQKVSVALTSGQVAAMKAVVDAGEYATTSEIVREALRDWQHKRASRQDELARARQLWDEGIESGDAGPLDFDDLRAEGRHRLETMKKVAG